jgi:hypothetical protein
MFLVLLMACLEWQKLVNSPEWKIPEVNSGLQISFLDRPAQIFSNPWAGIPRILSSMFPSWAGRQMGKRSRRSPVSSGAMLLVNSPIE